MLHNEIETIVAQATPPGYGGIGVIRISGPQCRAIARKILRKVPVPRIAAYGDFLDSEETVLDQGLALFFQAPHSFTGEDVLELQGHGGPVIIEALIQSILSMGARLATPGEFSLRAFLNNKIDLVQAEAVADLIHAHSLQAARSAMRSLQGDFSKAVQGIVSDVIGLRVFVESMIDFPEEAIEAVHAATIKASLQTLVQALEALLTRAEQGARLTRGARVMIMGLPNAGKSSLLNALSAQDAAIVTDIPGTTRDIVRSSTNLEGMIIELLDTAGLRTAQDAVEQEGIKRALDAASLADHIVWVCDASTDLQVDPLAVLDQYKLSLKEGVGITLLYNKIDLAKRPSQEGFEQPHSAYQGVFHISAKTGDGLSAFKQHLKKALGLGLSSENNFSARTRHIEALKEAKHCMQAAALQAQHASTLELVAEELRAVQSALDLITGRFTADDLLSKIFSTFCIGK